MIFQLNTPLPVLCFIFFSVRRPGHRDRVTVAVVCAGSAGDAAGAGPVDLLPAAAATTSLARFAPATKEPSSLASRGYIWQ